MKSTWGKLSIEEKEIIKTGINEHQDNEKYWDTKCSFFFGLNYGRVRGNENSLIYYSDEFEFTDEYDIKNKKWYGVKGLGYKIHVSFTKKYYLGTFEIQVYEVVQIKKNFWGNESLYVKKMDLYPFLPLIEFDKNYVNGVDFWEFIENKVYESCNLNDNDVSVLKNLYKELELQVKELKKNHIDIPQKEKVKVKNLLKGFEKEFDKDSNDVVDELQNDGYYKLIQNYRKEIQHKGSKYVQNLIKLNKYIEKKKDNINKLFKILKSSENLDELDFYLGTLRNEINLYNKIIFHSITLVNSIIDEDDFLFYEIYEFFDELNVFNSNWENQISGDLEKIQKNTKSMSKNLSIMTKTIYQMGEKINNSINKLTYTTEENISNLTSTMDKRLREVNSSVQTNNLLTLINTYQVYKINKNTKLLK